MKNTLFALFCILLLSSCKCCEMNDCAPNCPEPPDTTITTEKLKILWQQPMNKDTAETISMTPYFHNGNIIYSNLFYVDGYEFIKARNASDGALIWEWEPSWPGEGIKISRDYQENTMFLSLGGGIYAINLENGSNRWKEKSIGENEIGLRVSVFGNYGYTTNSNALIKDTVCHLVRRDLQGQYGWDTLFSIVNTVYRPNLEAPSLYINQAGDSLLIFQNRQWAFGLSDGRIDLLAFNLRTKALEWKVDDFDPEGNSNIERPLIYQGKIYFQGTKTLYCFNAETGNQLWSFQCPTPNDNLVVSNLLIVENTIYLKPSLDATLYGLDINTGAKIVEVFNTGSGGCQMIYYNNHIYYGSHGTGRLYAINIKTNQKIWDEYPPNHSREGKWKGNAFFRDVTIVPEHNCLIADDHYFVMAIKLPE